MLNKFRSALEKHKYFVAIFVFFVIYNFVIVGNFSFPKIDELTYTFHIVDFSIGFCPELLPGALYNALFPTTQVEVVNLYLNIIYHLFLLLVSFILEKFLYKFDLKNRFIAFIIVLFFITGPSTFSMHTIELGMLDAYWLFLTIPFLVMAQNKYLKWFVPVIFVLSVFIHIGALISFIPFFALIVLYEASQDSKANKKYMFIFAISVLMTAIIFIYFILFDESNLNLSLVSLRKLINERNLSEWEPWSEYYEYALYRVSYIDNEKMINSAVESGGNFFMQIFGVLPRQIKETLKFFPIVSRGYYIDFIRDVIISIPIIIFLYKFVLSFFKKEKENKLRRFVWFCTLCLLPFTFLTSIILSVDFIRWFGHGVICLFILVMYELYKSSDNDYLETINNRTNNFSRIAIIIYFVFYMMCTVEPYT